MKINRPREQPSTPEDRVGEEPSHRRAGLGREPTAADEFDFAQVEELEELAASTGEDFFRNLVTGFGTHSRQVLASLEAALDRADLKAVAKNSHHLKGSAATVGASHMAKVAGELELAARSGRTEEAQNLLSGLVSSTHKAIRMLDRRGFGLRSSVDAGLPS